LKSGIKGLEGSSNQNVSKVVLDNGTSLDADFVLFGTGITPNTDFVLPEVAQKNPDGGIVTNAFLQTT
jgi:3-phenylpropionate/trans-cinnamate dioxygenase ferredoxin reductase component